MMREAKLISIGDLFKHSWNLYRERIGVLTKIMLVPMALVILGDLLHLANPKSSLANSLVSLGLIISVFAALALIFALQEKVGAGESYRLVFRNFWSYLWLTILSGAVVLGGAVMLVIPAIIFSIWFIFTNYVFASEGEKGMNAILRSRQYVQGHWWQIFGRSLLLGIVILVLLLVCGFIAEIFAGDKGGGLIALITDVLIIVITPLATTYFYALYQNVKSLKPEVRNAPPTGPRGFFYVSAVLGVLGFIALAILFVFLAAAQGTLPQ